ncbi:hypothetical protein J5J10_09385 [Ciceribacter sp. L1K23]|uniref:hypothetical protein n=1 Tax=Ciceribacter sp. L1K23 TaxID=2820276 RepID=UPI001B83FB7B|nr:hypothetical protein [Ciceribacter sp. L1K23]MBR0555891.1 hypothetical protein [Ciceribacter sp. L1K23]
MDWLKRPVAAHQPVTLPALADRLDIPLTRLHAAFLDIVDVAAPDAPGANFCVPRRRPAASPTSASAGGLPSWTLPFPGMDRRHYGETPVETPRRLGRSPACRH